MRHTINRSKRQRIVAALDVGTSKVCCLIAKASPAPDWLDQQDGGLQYEIFGFGHQRAEGMKAGMITHMDLAEQSIRAAVDEAERMAGHTVEQAVLSVTCGRLKSENFSASVGLSTGSVRDEDISKVLNAGRQYAGREKRSVLHALPIGYRLDETSGINDPRGMCADRLGVDIHAVTADEVALRNLVLCVERCHLGVEHIAAAPYASALSVISKDESKLGVCCIDLGAGTSTISAFVDNQFVFADAIAVGSNAITTDIARALATPLDHAERLKTLHGSAFATSSDEREIITYPAVDDFERRGLNQITKAQLAEIIRPRIEEILDFVRRRLASSGFTPAPGQHVVLTGGGSQLTGLSDLASNMLCQPIRLGRPRGLSGLPEIGNGPVFATAIGLLLQWGRGEEQFALREQRFLRTGTGYLARVSEWIRESF
jgi:cell division protein FtsA